MQGSRLKADALNYRIDGKDIAQVNALSVGAAHEFFSELKPPAPIDQVASLILAEIRRRLGYLVGVGLEYSHWTANRARFPAARWSAST
jgi:excinuclease ABC subunit A